MSNKVLAKRISAATTFKILYVGFIVFHMASSFVISILAILGVLPLEPTTETLPFNSQQAVLVYCLFGLIFSPVWVSAIWFSIWPGVWLYSLVRPMSIGYIPKDDQRTP